MSRPQAPCLDCEARMEGCHTFCNRYTEYVKANEEYKAQRRAEKEKYCPKKYRRNTQL